MEKNFTKPLTIIVLSLLVIAAVLYLVKYSGFKGVEQPVNQTVGEPAGTGTPVELMTAEEKAALGLNKRGVFEVVSRNASGTVETYKIIGAEEPQAIDLVFMTDAEKLKKGISTSTKAQVLERNSAGEVTSYRVLNNDADIIKIY